jgi:hypothetical protein
MYYELFCLKRFAGKELKQPAVPGSLFAVMQLIQPLKMLRL